MGHGNCLFTFHLETKTSFPFFATLLQQEHEFHSSRPSHINQQIELKKMKLPRLFTYTHVQFS